jgi:hypothetical protein
MLYFLGSCSGSEDSYLLEPNTKFLGEKLSTRRGNSVPSAWVKPSFLKMQRLSSIETSVKTSQITLRHVAGDLNLLVLSLQIVSLYAKFGY